MRVGHENIINVDLDGVLYPYHEILAAYLELHGRYGPKIEVLDSGSALLPDPVVDALHLGESFPEPRRWEVWKDWGLPHGEYRNWFRRAIEDGFMWREGKPRPGSQEALWTLSDAGWWIRVVTRRLVHHAVHRQAIAATVEWLDEWNIPYRSIAFLGEESKADHLAQALWDDSWAEIKDWRFRHPDKLALLQDASWNREHPEEGFGRVRRIYRPNQVVAALDQQFPLKEADDER